MSSWASSWSFPPRAAADEDDEEAVALPVDQESRQVSSQSMCYLPSFRQASRCKEEKRREEVEEHRSLDETSPRTRSEVPV